MMIGFNLLTVLDLWLRNNLVISSVYALTDYIILIFILWPQVDHTVGHKGLWSQAEHRLDHICSEYDQPGFIL